MNYLNTLVRSSGERCCFPRGRPVKARVPLTITVITSVAVLFFNALPGRAGQTDSNASFTVKDSIEMSYIENVARRLDISLQTEHRLGVPIYSPDKKHFLLVTQRGVLSNNTLEGI